MATIPQALATAIQHHQAGRLQQAEATRRGTSPAAANNSVQWVDPQMFAHTCREAVQRIAGIELARVFNPVPLRQSLATR